MSEDTVAEQEPEETSEAEGQETVVETPAAAGDKFTLHALVVGAVSFVVILSMFIGVYVFKVSGGPVAESAQTGETAAAADPEGELKLVKLLENGIARVQLGPLGEASITYRYTIHVNVYESRTERLERLVDPEEDNKMPVVKERIRKIITAERPAKLRAEQLDGVKRQIVQELNLLMDGKVVAEVVFEVWDPV